MHSLVLVSCTWTCTLECAISAIICCIMVMSIKLSLGVGEEAGRSPIGGACEVLSRVCIAGCTVQGVLSVPMMTGEERDDELSAVAESSQESSGISC
jgi:hypothetical protein